MISDIDLSVIVLALLGLSMRNGTLMKFYMFHLSCAAVYASYSFNRKHVKTALALGERDSSLLYECSTLNLEILLEVSGKVIRIRFHCAVLPPEIGGSTYEEIS